MLNPKRSGGDRANDDTYDYFKKNGVEIQWANPKFYVTHEKSIVVDEEVALISTFNLCLKYFTQTRDYGVVTHDPVGWRRSLKALRRIGSIVTGCQIPRVACSGATQIRVLRMSHFIDDAKHKLDVQHPKFVDAVILDRLLEAADRGVHVRVLCGGKHGISDWDVLDTFSSLRVLKRFGVKVHKQKNLRLHAKLLIADDSHALVGSMNIDRSAFDLRRELGTTIKDEAVVKRLIDVFDSGLGALAQL